LAKLKGKALEKYEASRNLGEELLAAVRQMKSGKAARIHHVKMPEVLEARVRSGLSQQQFADVLGVSRRTLEAWEQGRRRPTGAARSLLTIAARHPGILKDALIA
jgi:putative transcriptional regulator